MFSDEEEDPFENDGDVTSDLSPIVDRNTLNEFLQRQSSSTVAQQITISSNCLFSDEEEDFMSFDSPLLKNKMNTYEAQHNNDNTEKDTTTVDHVENTSKNLQLNDIVKNYSQIRNEIAEIDEIARQLKIALFFKRESESIIGENSSFKSCITVRYLSTSAYVLIIYLENNSQFVLNSWGLTISHRNATPDPKNPTHFITESRSLDIGTFEVGQNKSFELFISNDEFQTRFYELELHKIFNIDGVHSCFRIPLTRSVVCLLHLLRKNYLTQTENNKFCSSIPIPLSLAKLLCPSSDSVSSGDLLRFLLTPSSLQNEIFTDSSSISISLELNSIQSVAVTFLAKIESKTFKLMIFVKDPNIRKFLVHDIQLYIIINTSLVKEFSNDYISHDYDVTSIEKLYTSLVEAYMQ